MRAILTCDIHARSIPSWRTPYSRRLLREISSKALSLGCDTVICAGDLWHEKHGVNPELLQIIYEELERSADNGVPWILLRGNHEIGLKSKPHETLLTLFSGIATIAVRPRKLVWNDTSVYFLPWYLGDQYRLLSQTLAKATVSDSSSKKILISHIGLNEGFVSPSNCYRVPQKVSLKDLHPECYNLVFLGDYHTTQHLGDRTMYGGSPIALQFGDAPDQGVWLLDTDGPEVSLQNVPLSGPYPKYKSLKIPQGFTAELKTDELHCRYKIQVHVDDAPKVRHLLGKDHVEVETYGTRTIDQSQRRLENVNASDAIAVFRTFLDSRSVQDPLYRDLGEHAIKRAMGELYGATK